VRCTRGSIFLVMVDLRPDSPSTSDCLGVELTARTSGCPYVPEGFAHAYQTPEDDTEFLYHMSHNYVPEAARGARWDDPAFGIAWPPAQERVISSEIAPGSLTKAEAARRISASCGHQRRRPRNSQAGRA
jgi:dTDP-4-dehydrorhamnose 3,5-epimerase